MQSSSKETVAVESTPIATYVFFDTETTGLITDGKIPDVTELCMIAIKRRHLLASKADEDLRVQYKLLMCFRPYQEMTAASKHLSGFNEQLLDQETRWHFNLNVFNTIKSFIKVLKPPVCLIAHDGLRFHFPIVKQHFKAEDFHLSRKDDMPNLKCSDSLLAFYDLLEAELIENVDFDVAPVTMHISQEKSYSQLMRNPFFAPNDRPADSYKLNDIYLRVFGDAPLDPKRAENQCIMMMKIAQTRANRFVQWVDENHCAFSAVPPTE